MKKLSVLLFAVLTIGVSLYSQDAYLELLRADLKAEHVAIVTENMELSDAQSRVFWPVYRKYDAELTGLNDQVIALIKDYDESFDKMTNDKADSLTKRLFSLLGKRLNLQEKYYKEVAKVLDPILATKFMQIERQLMAVIDLQVSSEIPLITK